MNAVLHCEKHNEDYVQGNGCFSCFEEKQAEKASTMTLAERLRDEELFVDASDEAADVLEEALKILQGYKDVIKELGRGIGSIAVPAKFFALWNDTEVAANKLIAKLK